MRKFVVDHPYASRKKMFYNGTDSYEKKYICPKKEHDVSANVKRPEKRTGKRLSGPEKL